VYWVVKEEALGYFYKVIKKVPLQLFLGGFAHDHQLFH